MVLITFSLLTMSDYKNKHRLSISRKTTIRFVYFHFTFSYTDLRTMWCLCLSFICTYVHRRTHPYIIRTHRHAHIGIGTYTLLDFRLALPRLLTNKRQLQLGSFCSASGLFRQLLRKFRKPENLISRKEM